jgi:TatA/E family protein of Tat protein translocase
MERLFYLIPAVLIIVLIFGGAGKLPEIGSAMGRAIREFRSAVTGQDSAAPLPGDRAPVPVPDDSLPR